MKNKSEFRKEKTVTPFMGERFNTSSPDAIQAGPQSLPTVPPPPKGLSLTYSLEQIVSKYQYAQIKSTGIMAFHCIGDSGGGIEVKDPDKNTADVARLMESQCLPPNQIGGPCFCYHVGDVVYPFGNEDYYEDEFYKPYSVYGKAIVAIPGNHDYFGDHLAAYKKNFLQPKLHFPKSGRPEMNLPWYYWVLETPVATIIGLAAISNSIGNAQQDWFNNQLKHADPEKAIIVAVHYPPYSVNCPNYLGIINSLSTAYKFANRVPDLLLSGHSHNYQRFTINSQGELPAYTSVISGAGGNTLGGPSNPPAIKGTTLESYTPNDYGALKVTVNNETKEIRGHFYSVSEPEKPFDEFCISYNRK